jgi:hypothetical protein
LKFLEKESVTTGITTRHDRRNKFRISRIKDGRGLHIYVLQNLSMGEKIFIPRFLMDRFRSILTTILHKEIEAESEAPIDIKVYFRDVDYYAIKSAKDGTDRLAIQELSPAQGSTGFFTLERGAVRTLVDLLYDARLKHPNDILGRIISYHKLFNFTFVEGSESITSDLSLRKDVLSHVTPYLPTLAKKDGGGSFKMPELNGEHLEKKAAIGTEKPRKSDKTAFRSRLAEKNSERSYQVEFESLFKRSEQHNSEKVPKAAHNASDKSSDAALAKTFFSIPILASDIKSFAKPPFRIELTAEEIKELRDHFLGDRESDYYIGFELIDVIFRHNNKLQTYRFPLYYFRVKIEESGRQIFLRPVNEGTCYLNHLALANTVETFAESARSGNPVDNFFNTLLAQKIEVTGRIDRVRLSRILPVEEAVFDKTREILIGLPGENGKGGILDNLNVVGIECDLESTALYKASRSASPLLVALDEDLVAVEEIAHDYPDRFYSSLLGRFLTPEISLKEESASVFSTRSLMPGSLPSATRRLLDKLNHHNLVLLEGPPGTGKTFTIMNLFFQCVNTDKRLLIVSDQKAALHALMEKLEEYLIGRDRSSPYARHLMSLWKMAIKVVDETPSDSASLQNWIRDLSQMLDIENMKELDLPAQCEDSDTRLTEIDGLIAGHRDHINGIMDRYMGPESDVRHRVTPKRLHATTVEDIKSLTAFLQFLGLEKRSAARKDSKKSKVQSALARFIKNREYLLKSEWQPCYDLFALDHVTLAERKEQFKDTEKFLSELLTSKPRSLREFRVYAHSAPEHVLTDMCLKIWEQHFPPFEMALLGALRKLWSYLRFPLLKRIRVIHRLVADQLALFDIIKEADGAVINELNIMHAAIQKSEDPPLALEICRFSLQSLNADEGDDHDSAEDGEAKESIQSHLMAIEELQKKRDDLIREVYLGKLAGTAAALFHTSDNGGTSALTTIKSLLDSLKDCRSISQGSGVPILKELKQKLFDTFPIWLCRKQVVSFLFPTKEQIFDLVIVDEAGQCRVDDALPLLFRAKKLMVVGDDKQTVLEKNSVIDDYLFSEFDLDEHLRFTGARGIKGGGSNIFGLVKSIKQASVMLEEHYRCPPDIIQFSNKYVYDSSLKIMQWSYPGQPPAVEVNYSEEKAPASDKPASGKFKGIEVDMIDRFLDYVAATIKKIEKETGSRINMETDVALCYFLLKNEPYIKAQKAEFLRKLDRGNDVLDGAGTALQGKERNYIFYLWDINRYNMAAFRQGDDVDKRKGELNVLMSRPKRKAFHYLHKYFSDLDHASCTITDYLWQTYKTRADKAKTIEFTPREKRPGKEFIPWRRSSGALMQAIFNNLQEQSPQKISSALTGFNPQCSVIVGDPQHKVDLMLVPQHENRPDTVAVGLIDLCGFDPKSSFADDVIDYYFQLQRARPPIAPVFLFIHELADVKSATHRLLLQSLEKSRECPDESAPAQVAR